MRIRQKWEKHALSVQDSQILRRQISFSSCWLFGTRECQGSRWPALKIDEQINDVWRVDPRWSVWPFALSSLRSSLSFSSMMNEKRVRFSFCAERWCRFWFFSEQTSIAPLATFSNEKRSNNKIVKTGRSLRIMVSNFAPTNVEKNLCTFLHQRRGGNEL